MVYIATPYIVSDSLGFDCLESLPLTTTPTYDQSNSVSSEYAVDIAGSEMCVWRQCLDPPLSSPLSASEARVPLERKSSLRTPWWVANGIAEGKPLLGLDLQLEPVASKSGEHDSGLLSPLLSDLLALPPVPPSPCWTSDSTTPILRDTKLIEVYNRAPLPKAPAISPRSPSSYQSPPPLSEYPSLKTFSSPEIRSHSTPVIGCQSPPEFECSFVRLHPTDENHNPKYYTQQTGISKQQPTDLPSLSLQPQFGHSQSAPEFESVADSSSAVPDYFTSEFMRDDREPIIHPSHLRKLPNTGSSAQHAPSFHKSAKRPSVSLPDDYSPMKRMCIR